MQARCQFVYQRQLACWLQLADDRGDTAHSQRIPDCFMRLCTGCGPGLHYSEPTNRPVARNPRYRIARG
jgi:hypothetical protein